MPIRSMNRKFLPVFFLAVLAAGVQPVSAESITGYGQVYPLTQRPVLHTRVPFRGDSGTIDPERMSVRVSIHGYLAETAVTLTFQNASDSIFEGYLLFSVPEGGIVNGYSLVVGNETVDGVIQEQARARMILEREMGRAVDPGIVEWVQGNVYRTRVYPVPRRGARTFTIRWVERLHMDSGKPDAQYAYGLPVQTSEPMSSLDIKIRCIATGDPVQEPSVGKARFRFESRDGEAAASYRAERVSLNETITLRFPGLNANTAWVEKADDGEYYFAVHPGTMKDRPAEQREIRSLSILWDASHSRYRSNHDAEIALVERLITALKPEVLYLSVFRNNPEAPIVFLDPVRKAAVIASALKNTVYDGGSDIAGALDALSSFSPSAGTRGTPDVCLLFSDGYANLDRFEPKSPGFPVFTIAEGDSANTYFLSEISRISGGVFLNRSIQNETAVLTALQTVPFGLVSVNSRPGEIEDVQVDAALRRGTPELLTGKLVSDSATVTLDYGYGARRLENVTFTVRKRDAGDQAAAVRALWASRRLSKALAYRNQNADAVVREAGRYGIVTPFTSFIVLETGEQYAGYGVEPPAANKRLVSAYQDAKKKLEARTGKVKADHERNLIESVASRLSWNMQDFSGRLRTTPQPLEVKPPEILPKYWPTGGGCFVAGTPVATSSGSAAIESIVPGTLVYAYDPIDSSWKVRKAVKTLIHEYDGDVIRITAGEETVTATGNHPFRVVRGKNLAGRPAPADLSAQDARFTPEGRWVEARDLLPGDILLSVSGKTLPVKKLARSEMKTTVYNLTIEEFHTYAVGAAGILVHNKGQAESASSSGPSGGQAEGGGNDPSAGSVTLRQSEKMRTFYTRFIDKFRGDDPYSAYGAIKDLVLETGSEDPSLYLETSQWFFDNGFRDLGIRILTNMAEVWPDVPQLLRVLALRLEKAGEYRLSEYFLRRAVALQPDFVQQYRSLALLCEKAGRYDESLRLYAHLLDLSRGWWVREDLEKEKPVANEAVIAVTDYARIREKAKTGSIPAGSIGAGKELWKKQEFDIRIVLSWDSDYTWNTGLLVTEPSGENASYMNVRTQSGGAVIPDHTNYGMEEYTIVKAAPGRYTISSINTAFSPPSTGPVLARVLVYLNYGRLNEQVKESWCFLLNGKQLVEIAAIDWKP